MQVDVIRAVRSCGLSVILLASTLTLSLTCVLSDAESVLGPFDKMIEGTVYDDLHDAVGGVTVKVDIWVGYWPENYGVLSGTRTTVSDAWGYYAVTFDANEWSTHYVIEILGTKDLTQWSENAEANGDQIQTVDLDSPVAIPEFDGPATTVLAVISVSAILIILAGRKKRA